MFVKETWSTSSKLHLHLRSIVAAFLWVGALLATTHAYGQPSLPNPRQFYVIYHNGHFLAHNTSCTTIQDATSFDINTCVWEADIANHWGQRAYIIPTIPTTTPGANYKILNGGNPANWTGSYNAVSLVTPGENNSSLFYAPNDGGKVRTHSNAFIQFNGTTWYGGFYGNDSVNVAVFYTVSYVNTSTLEGGSLSITPGTLELTSTGSTALTLNHEAPISRGTPPYYYCRTGSTDHYYYNGTTQSTAPSPTSVTPLTLDHFEWSLSGAGASYLSLSQGSTTTVSNSLVCNSLPTAAAATATLTVTAYYTEGETRSTTLTITLQPCSLPQLTVENNQIRITATGGASRVQYTTDGSDPATATPVASPALLNYTGTGFTLKALNEGSTCVLQKELPTLAAPTITMSCDNLVTLSGTGGELHYTTDGSTPTASSPAYSMPFALTGSSVQTVQAMQTFSWEGGILFSATASEQCYLHATAPTLQMEGNTVVISGSGTIYYTLNGTEPTNSSSRYTFPIPVDISTEFTIRAIAYEGSLLPSCVAVFQFTHGSGTESDPYRIYDLTGLRNISNDATKAYRIEADIDASALTSPITATFSGLLESAAKEDGTFYAISGLSTPLFSTASNATVRNLLFTGTAINGSGPMGAVCGQATGSTRIYNCGVLSGTVGSNNGYAGSLVGQLSDNARVVNCYSLATLTGGSEVGGIVGHNSYASTANDLRSMVMNCMFYGDITGGTSRYPVYGGQNISNAGTGGINNYNYYRDESSLGTLTNKNCAWPAEEEFLTRFEYFRSILNCNRELAAWYVSGDATDTALIAKWVLDPLLASYPVLKRWGYYPSVINENPEVRWNATTGNYQARTETAPYEGRALSTLTVTIHSGAQGGSATRSRTLQVLDMDTLHHNYGYAYVQLPYYNELFGDPTATTHAARYAGNYTNKVVTGWKITSVTGGTPGTFVADWETGYDFADRKCTAKDLYAQSQRVFAQGGYYYVPEGVTAIEIEAYWGNAVYVCNGDRSIDRVNDAQTAFAPAGTKPATFNGRTVYASLWDAQEQLQQSGTVYDQALVLVSNIQLRVGNSNLLSRDDNRPYTLMSVDLNFDNEPDYCLQLQVGEGYEMARINPVRFDFVAVPDLGLAVKQENTAYRLAVGVFMLRGHFEITETSFIHFNEFRYDDYDWNGRKQEAPLILNGGQFIEFITKEDYGWNFYNNGLICDRTSYMIVGGHVQMRNFFEGIHNSYAVKTRHCAMNILGGQYEGIYLSGNLRDLKSNEVHADNPHCYILGGHIGLVAGAGQEAVNGNVYFRIDHSLIGQMYGGGTNAACPITGNVEVHLLHSRVNYYCGGPMVGNMAAGKTIHTYATSTTFGQYFGAGNGGTSWNLDASLNKDNDANSQMTEGDQLNWWMNDYTPYTFNSTEMGYMAQYRFEIWNLPSGTNGNHAARRYIYDAQFATTTTRDVYSQLDSCVVLTDYYGAGNLGGVDGNVESQLTHTEVFGSAYGGGYSAKIPSFYVYTKVNLTLPHRDNATGLCYNGIVGDSVLCQWTNSYGSTAAPHTVQDGQHYLYTELPLTNLGSVSGNTTLILKGTSVVHHSLFGGGNESHVEGNTHVQVLNGTLIHENVYGGGNRGTIGGNTEVKIGEE